MLNFLPFPLSFLCPGKKRAKEGAGNYAHHCDTISGAAKAVKAAPAAAAAPCNLTLTDVDASPCGLVATLVRGTERNFVKKSQLRVV